MLVPMTDNNVVDYVRSAGAVSKGLADDEVQFDGNLWERIIDLGRRGLLVVEDNFARAP